MTEEQLAEIECSCSVKQSLLSARLGRALLAHIRELQRQLAESEQLLNKATQRMMRINVNYRSSSGLPPRLQAYCMRSEAAAGLGIITQEELEKDLATILKSPMTALNALNDEEAK